MDKKAIVMEFKTNVMRMLDRAKIKYNSYSYANTNAISGLEVAKALNQDKNKVFKTLVTSSKSGNHYVFMIPVEKELDLKKAARAVGEKSVEMIPQKELLPLTGYVHGGCSPIGMKKQFLTCADESALELEEIMFSAGKLGRQIKMRVSDLQKAVELNFFDLCK